MYIARKSELDILKKGEDKFKGKTQNLFNQPRVFISTKQLILLKPMVRRPMGLQPKVQRRSSWWQSMGRQQWLGRKWQLGQQRIVQPWLVRVQIYKKFINQYLLQAPWRKKTQKKFYLKIGSACCTTTGCLTIVVVAGATWTRGRRVAGNAGAAKAPAHGVAIAGAIKPGAAAAQAKKEASTT